MGQGRRGETGMWRLERDTDSKLELVRDKSFSKHIVHQAILLDWALESTLPGDGAIHIGGLAAAKPKSDIGYNC